MIKAVPLGTQNDICLVCISVTSLLHSLSERFISIYERGEMEGARVLLSKMTVTDNHIFSLIPVSLYFCMCNVFFRLILNCVRGHIFPDF